MIWWLFGAAGFGFGAAVDPIAMAAHDEHVERCALDAFVTMSAVRWRRALWSLTHAAHTSIPW